MKRQLCTVVAAALVVGCSPLPSLRPERPASAQGAAIGAWGVDLAGMDRSVRPGDDFYRYAGGTWLKTTQIPADRTMWDTLARLDADAERDVRTLVEPLTSRPQAPGSIEQKVADAYASYVDTARIETLGLAPFRDDLAAIAALRTHEDVAAFMASPGMPGNGPIVFAPVVDDKDPDRYTITVGQAGLGLPNRDYYLGEAPAFAALRPKYRDHIARMLSLAEVPGAEASAAAILALERRIAEIHWPLAKLRDRDLTYNPMHRRELVRFAPGFPWETAFRAAELPADYDRFVVQQRDAIPKLAALFRATPVETWRAYLAFHYLSAQADIMPAAFDRAHFEFYGTLLAGQPQQRERWKRAVADLNGWQGTGPLAQAVGRLYVRVHFPPESKAMVGRLVDDLLATYQRRIERLAWMSPETRAVAIRKAQTVRVKIGYPERWRDYDALAIAAGDAYGNRMREKVFEYRRQMSRLEQKTDRDEWEMAPQTVNAYYRPEFNEIVFPAAILQAPLFDPHADPAVNYGGVGGVIGHEMGHGYDDQGAKSDERGILRTWWKAEDTRRFQALTKALATQYDAYEPLPGLHVNGAATSGENIGDLGGLTVAYDAYRASLGGKPAPVLDGFTGDQRFFLGWAQVWRALYRDETLRLAVTSDFHSPNEYRVNGVVRNMDPWYRAFDVAPSEALFLAPDARVRIW